jgi:hypothetical protein
VNHLLESIFKKQFWPQFTEKTIRSNLSL